MTFKCDQIQTPPTGKFDSNALVWARTTRRCAWIPDWKLDDFIHGEEHCENFNTTFFKQQRKEIKNAKMEVVEKVSTWYHYTFMAL